MLFERSFSVQCSYFMGLIIKGFFERFLLIWKIFHWYLYQAHPYFWNYYSQSIFLFSPHQFFVLFLFQKFFIGIYTRPILTFGITIHRPFFLFSPHQFFVLFLFKKYYFHLNVISLCVSIMLFTPPNTMKIYFSWSKYTTEMCFHCMRWCK